MPAGKITKARREKETYFPSCSYTPTAICLYTNDFAPIPNLKRISEKVLSTLKGEEEAEAQKRRGTWLDGRDPRTSNPSSHVARIRESLSVLRYGEGV